MSSAGRRLAVERRHVDQCLSALTRRLRRLAIPVQRRDVEQGAARTLASVQHCHVDPGAAAGGGRTAVAGATAIGAAAGTGAAIVAVAAVPTAVAVIRPPRRTAARRA